MRRRTRRGLYNPVAAAADDDDDDDDDQSIASGDMFAVSRGHLQ